MAGSQVEIMANQVEDQRAGFQAMSLTEFDSLLEPQIEAGSVVEIAGALFEFTALESITGWAGIANNSDVYIKLVVAGTSVTAAFTTVAPTWAAAKQGWYNVAESERYVFRLRKNSLGEYADKRLLLLSPAGQVDQLTLSAEKLLLPFTPADGATQIYAADAEVSVVGATPTKKKEIYMPFTGTVNVYFEVRSLVDNYRGRIYVNGVAVGTLRVGAPAAYAPFTEAIAVTRHDKLQLYIYNQAGGSTTLARNFRVRCDKSIAGSILELLPVIALN